MPGAGLHAGTAADALVGIDHADALLIGDNGLLGACVAAGGILALAAGIREVDKAVVGAGQQTVAVAVQIQAALELLEMGAQNVLVSLGGEGALWVSESCAMFAPAVPVRVQSTVGAGDAMVGGVMTGLEKTGDVRRALAYGAAAGCASVMTEGTQLIRPDDFAALLPQVQIQDV